MGNAAAIPGIGARAAITAESEGVSSARDGVYSSAASIMARARATRNGRRGGPILRTSLAGGDLDDISSAPGKVMVAKGSGRASARTAHTAAQPPPGIGRRVLLDLHSHGSTHGHLAPDR